MDHDGETRLSRPRARARTRFEGNTVVEPARLPETPADSPAADPATQLAGPAPAVVRSAGSLPGGLLRAVRPRQWPKNLLVFAAPLASGTVIRPDVLAATALAFVLFCVVAGGVYLLNDVRDVEEDRRHPTKRHRPVAAGVVPAALATVVGGVLIVAAVAGAVAAGRPHLAGVLGAYAGISLAYTWFLKDQPVIDLAVVASGFLLRGVAGGVAAGIPLSQWFLLVAAFGALFMVAGKRYAELVALGEAAATRRSLSAYSASYLRFVWGLSAGVACTTYSLWAFEMRAVGDGFPWSALSIAPFVLALLRYAVDVDRGRAGTPEDIVLRDRGLLVLGLVWLVLFGLGVFTR